MHIAKRFDSCFVVEESKLTRLTSVITETLQQARATFQESFEATLTGAKTIKTESLRTILDLDNSERNRVEGLLVEYRPAANPAGSSSGITDDTPAHGIRIEFSSAPWIGIKIDVVSGSDRVASELMSVAEEQVERMLQRSFMYRLVGRRDKGGVIAVSICALLFTLLIALYSINPPNNTFYRDMWLTPSDLAEIRPLVEADDTLTPEQATGILQRQLRNLLARRAGPSLDVFLDWRVNVILLLATIIVVSLFALMQCYPGAVFRWGDAEDRYRTLLTRRKLIWSVVIGALVIGIMGNLAVNAFGSLIGERSM